MQLAANVVIAERFRLSRQLGQGGMGSVWLATHLALDIPCAVKFIEGEIAQLPEAQARFEREAKAAAQLRSPHVVQILDHGVWQGTPYIAMELLDGEDVGKRLTRIGRMAPNEVLRIVSQVCRALHKAHGVGIVHRDLKPDNIFLVPDDDREIAKVLDFGIAKTGAGGLDGSNTKTGAMLGTPYYMSPEQAQGIKAVDHRSDLWSLAVIVFQALTGRLPFESEALGDLLVRIIVAPVPMPSRYVNDLPPAFDRWWERASQREPSARFQSAKELGDALAIAFGHSQGIGGDSGNYRPMQHSEANAALGGAPFGHTPNPATFGNTPQPQFGNTPQPAFGTSGTQAMGNAQGALALAGQAGLAPTTGATMSRTFDGPVDGVPRSRKGLFTALAVGAVALVVLGAVAVTLTGKKDAPVAAAPSSPVATTAETAPPPPAPKPAASAAPVAVAIGAPPSVAAPPITASPAPAIAPAPKPGHAAPPRPAANTAPPPATPSGKKPRVDLGI